MESPKSRVRRATLEDLGSLTALWKTMDFDTSELARRVTEFQLAEDGDGKLLGAVGLQIANKQGLLHSEAFNDFSLADILRPLIWERLHSVAVNHGLLRLWTREQAPFWNQCGLQHADEALLEKLPKAWNNSSAKWLTLKLKDDIETLISVDKEFALFMESEKQKTQRALAQAKVLKFIATLLALALFGVVMAGAVYVFKKNPGILMHR
jgi:N-acetylglutamate synthase-like GNAT family acetyltransferase